MKLNSNFFSFIKSKENFLKSRLKSINIGKLSSLHVTLKNAVIAATTANHGCLSQIACCLIEHNRIKYLYCIPETL